MQNYTTHVPPELSDADKLYLGKNAKNGLIQSEWLRLNGKNEAIRKQAGAMSEAFCSVLRACGYDADKAMRTIQQEVLKDFADRD